MMKRYGLSSMLLFLCIVLCAAPARAQWAKDGVLVCGEIDYQWMPRIVTDDAGGAIVVWLDQRNGGEYDLYGNRIDREGNVFGGGGLPLAAAPGTQYQHRLIPDGTGGAFVVWADSRAGDGYYDVYAQKVDGQGSIYWPENGLAVCTAPGTQDGPKVVPDLAGGAIFIWMDYRKGQYDIYAQRVTGAGDTLWAANGIPIDTSMGDQDVPEVVPDGSGGAIMIWTDGRNGDSDIYAQRIDVNGNLVWGPDAVPVCIEPGGPSNPRLVATSDGGACVAWTDYRNGYSDVYAQKIDQNGQVLWQGGGMAVCPESWNKYSAQLTGDGAGGAIVVWYDERNYNETYAQRIQSDGSLAWAEDGVMVFPSYGDDDPRIMPDGAGGAFVALDIYWDEEEPSDIYIQRLDHDGNLLWGLKGSAVCVAENEQFRPVLAPDGSGGVIVAWEDYRANTGSADIYCQRVGASGLWGDPAPGIVSCLDLPNDQGGWVRITARASSHDVAGETDSPIMGYNVWRMITGGGGPLALSASPAPVMAALDRAKLLALLSDPATANGVRASGSQAAALGLPPGEWESVGFWFATRDTLYNAVVPTRNDSTEMGPAEETFIVTAHTSIAGVFVASEPATGYSVDNLAPGLTAGFAGNEIASPPGLALSWTPNAASDIWKYNVYRGDDELFVPGVSNLLGTTDGTGYHDGTWVYAYQYFYKLAAVDRHGNMGPAALLRPEDVNVGTTLQSFAASLSGSFVEISWTLSEAGADTRFAVLRSAAGGSFEELESPQIERDGLSFSLVDRSCDPGMAYRYRVDVIDESGSRTLFETQGISTPAMPLTLNQNHPNPFNPSTTIGYYLPSDVAVTLEVYATSGRLVARLLNGAKQAKGTHSVEWRGVDAQGRAASSGVYFYRLTCGKETISRKMILLR